VSEDAQDYQEIMLEPIATASGWHAYHVPDQTFPLHVRQRKHMAALVEGIADAIARSLGAVPTLWIDSQPLHHDGGSRIFSAHSRAWSSRMGFCFDPAGDPPRKLSMADLMDVDYGTPPKLHDRTSIHISSFEQTLPAYRMLAGRGISTLIFFEASGPADSGLMKSVDAFMQHTRKYLQLLMSPGSFQGFPFYLPLLSAKSVAQATALQLATWTGNATACLHESFDTRELLFLSRHNLDPVLKTAALRRLSSTDGLSPWGFRIPSDKEPLHA
jgi:hypothetical protein